MLEHKDILIGIESVYVCKMNIRNDSESLFMGFIISLFTMRHMEINDTPLIKDPSNELIVSTG